MRYKALLLISIALIICCTSTPLHGLSMVYSLRVAQITRQPLAEEKKTSCTLLGLPFNMYEKKRDGLRNNFFGGLASFIYGFDEYYVRVDAAVADVHSKMCGVPVFSGTVPDDILFTVGRTYPLKHGDLVTFSGLLGIPTHRPFELQHVNFGHSQVGLGIQIDGLCPLIKGNTLIYGTRYIYFVPRDACDPSGYVHRFSIGNIVDLLLGVKKDWERHGIEVGWTERFRFEAECCPAFDSILERIEYTRTNFYGVYKYKFSIHEVKNRFLINVAYSFDGISQRLGDEGLIIVWGAWEVTF